MRKGFWEEILYAKMEIILTKTHLRTVFVFLYHYEKKVHEKTTEQRICLNFRPETLVSFAMGRSLVTGRLWCGQSVAPSGRQEEQKGGVWDTVSP